MLVIIMILNIVSVQAQTINGKDVFKYQSSLLKAMNTYFRKEKKEICIRDTILNYSLYSIYFKKNALDEKFKLSNFSLNVLKNYTNLKSNKIADCGINKYSLYSPAIGDKYVYVGLKGSNSIYIFTFKRNIFGWKIVKVFKEVCPDC